MKKVLSIIFALISVLCVAFAFSACGEDEKDFYTLSEAYKKGLLTREQVMSIAYYHNGGIRDNEKIMGEDYVPLPKTPEELSAETELALCQAYLEFCQQTENSSVSEYRLAQYCGTYNGCAAVMMVPVSGGFFDMMSTEEVAGITIVYNNSNTIQIWKNA